MRKIALVTSTRADYGILSRLITMLDMSEDVDFLLLVTGTHLSEKYGMTKTEISQKIYKEVDIEIEESPSHALALAVEKFSSIFKNEHPDLVVLLGDRYEIMGVAQAAMLNNIPIAHLFGGDTTEGAIDEAIRHCITKMSHLHFTSCEAYRTRVIQLGESPDRVYNFGSLAIDNIKHIKLMEKFELETSLGFSFAKRNLLITFHPVTLEGNCTAQIVELLKALDTLTDTNLIFTMPNSDDGSDEISKALKEYAIKRENVKIFTSLGMRRYLSCMKYVDAVVGNSSSGIYEAPSFKIPTINIGSRQKGRLQSSSIINCEPNKDDILKAINIAYSTDFSKTQNIYEKPNTAEEILNVLLNIDISNILKKKFYNLK